MVVDAGVSDVANCQANGEFSRSFALFSAGLNSVIGILLHTQTHTHTSTHISFPFEDH